MAFDKQAAEAGKRKAQARSTIQIPRPPKGSIKKLLINLIVTVVFGFVYFYVKLPAINLHSMDFYFFFFMLSLCYCAAAVVTSGIWKLRGEDTFFRSVVNHCKVPLAVCVLFLVVILVGNIASSVIFRAGAYRALLEVQTGSFDTDIAEISFEQIPMLDKDSAEKLGDRKLGELADMVSQFEVSNQYAQINYNGRPVRVTPLEYGDLIKWFNNRREGLPGYILIDMVSQNAEVVRLPEGMKYSTNEHFGRNLMRHLRFQYPTYMFGTPGFEINEQGEPYWVCPRLVKRIGLFGGTDVEGAVLVNAVTGESMYYEDAPTWVDRVYPAELIIQQYDYYGLYVNGFINSILGQKGVTITTDGYNYIAQNDDVYMYTGITSVGGDQSNIGFILSNQRTKETRFYEIAGAQEMSAESSAEGVVQHLGYNATFPILLNLGGEPTYFMSLKDAAGLVKMYAMVNVQSYQLVATGTTVAECEKNYLALLRSEGAMDGSNADAAQTVEGVVEDVRSAVLDGETVFYVRLASDDVYYAIAASDAEQVVVLNRGDRVSIVYAAGDGLILSADSLTILERVTVAAPTWPSGGESADSTADADDTAGDDSDSGTT